MASKVKLETGKSGATASARRILAGVSTTSAEPTLSSDGYLLQNTEVFHFLFDVGGTSPVFSLQVWYYTTISGTWHKAEALTVNSDDLVTIEHDGFHRVYLQVVGVTGTSPTLNAWLALVKPL